MNHQGSKSEPARARPDVYRIFLASPGDVRDERELARKVIEQIRAERAFRGRVSLQCIAWDQSGAEVAMEAALTPQEAIKRGLAEPSQCDLVVVIFWSRMGTPLPAEYKKPNGTTYLSGTEWEFQDAVSAAKRSGRPAVWLYRRKQDLSLNPDDPEFKDKCRQWQAVKDFFEAFETDSGALTGGVNHYGSPDAFRSKFEQHLRDHLTAVTEELQRQQPTAPLSPEPEEESSVRWVGAPYPGLEAFRPEQEPIFFGRGPEVGQLLEVLRDPTAGFIAMVGPSGAGKSSLVSAGLIPRLRSGALPGSGQWVHVGLKPGERGGDPFLALAYALKKKLGTTGQREPELARELRADPEGIVVCADRLLHGRPRAAELLLVIDQFEELFTVVDREDGREAFFSLLKTAAEAPRIRVLATMRVDFTANVSEVPALTPLFRGRGLFLLSAPGVLAMGEMIRRPAQMADLKVDDELCDRILKDTGTGAGALALMAFTLNELYQRGKQSGHLTLHDYRALGGVEGAIDEQAEKAYRPLAGGSGSALSALFRDLVEVNQRGVATRRRTDLKQIEKEPAKAALARALVEARILVTDREEAENPTLEVAHEAVFSGWRRLSRWIEEHAGELRVCSSLTRTALDWQEAGAPPFRHLPDRATLKQFRRIRPSCSLDKSDDEMVKRFLGAARRRQRLWAGFLALIVLLVSGLGTESWMQNRELSFTALRIYTQAKLGCYQGPPMEKISGKTFEMGWSGCNVDRTNNECPRHPVTIQTFEMGRYEVTFDEYAAFAADTDGADPPSGNKRSRGSRPVISVSWNDAQAYIKWLSRVTGKPFRLPSEAEWEFAARAGTTTEFSFGNDETELEKYAWYSKNAGGHPHPVGTRKPNAWGLYDMHGNVWEWVKDDWHRNYKGAPDDGSPWVDAPRRGTYRVIRGGSWDFDARYCRSAFRLDVWPGIRGRFLGFRLARSVTPGP